MSKKYKIINGWTKKKMKQAILEGNNGTRSTGASGACLYRGLNGNKCAVGCFIPDGRYCESFESGDLSDVLQEIEAPLDYIGMVRMQRRHDSRRVENENENIAIALCQWIDDNCQE